MIRDQILGNEKIQPNSKEIETLKANFPQFFDESGQFLQDRFMGMLKSNEVVLSKEGYELKFLGKSYARYLSSTATETFLAPQEEDNAKPENKDSENLYIIGDNLDALKHLLNSYSGKIKCIYIDPPYNTGSDGFVYPDNFKFNAKELAQAIGIEEEESDRILNLAGKSSHSAWLTFMYPRLILARELLSDDGVIFISIDDNEQANLKMACDEIFGEENFIASIVRNTNSSKNQSLFVSVSHEYCFVYSKYQNNLALKHAENKWAVDKNNIDEYLRRVKVLQDKGLASEEITEELKELTKYPRFIDFTNYWYFDEKGLYRKGDLGGVTSGNSKPLFNPMTGRVDPVPPGGYRFNEIKLEELVKANRIHFHTDGSLPTIKRYLHENKKQRPKSIMSDDQRPDYSLLQNFNTPFDNPKQMSFMTRILSIFEKDSLVLDFFSGSATTAHAVMQLNAEDGGNRKYIMVQLPEVIKEDKPAYQAGYRTIDEIGRERIRRAAKKIQEETGADIDYGFKTFKLEPVNQNTLNKMIDFNPGELLVLEDMVGVFDTDKSSGKSSILSTWLNEDGYGLTAEATTYSLSTYEADLYKDSLYIINEGIRSEDVMELVKRLETMDLDINRVVAYPYSIDFSVMHELKKNIKNLRNNKSVEVIERY